MVRASNRAPGLLYFVCYTLLNTATMYDLIIIGGGPAAAAGAVYAARKQLKTLLIAKEFGGQSTVSPDIFNWIGTVSISGEELAKSLKKHVQEYEGDYLDIQKGVAVTNVTGSTGAFTVTTSKDESHTTRTVLMAAGAHRRKLDVPGATEFDQKGLTYCASCDGPVFSGMDVAVIGGGNAGFESAAQLLAYTKSVTLLNNGPRFKAEAITVEKVLAHPNMTAINNADTTEILGEGMVKGLTYTDKETGEEKTLDVQGVFVEIGMVPNTDIVDGLVELDDYKRVIVDPKNQTTSVPGVWAAGDCTNELYHQNNIAAGDAVKALEDIYVYIKTR
jgi:alkyl hydroperoxide reductase subunit F